MNVAVIPARGGSKRIPRKNIRPFGGKPMIAHSIECAIESRVFERIIVSTDDAEIASIARDAGAEVPFTRPANLSDDNTGTTEVVAHAVAELSRRLGQLSAVCCIYPTAPFMRATDIEAGLRLLETGEWRYVFAATSFGASVQRSFRLADDGGVVMFFPAAFESRSQDLPEAFQDAGQFYWGTPRAWLDGARVFDRHSTVIRIPRWRNQDIDTADDWEHASLLWKMLHDKRKPYRESDEILPDRAVESE